jgi:hypothetical protein
MRMHHVLLVGNLALLVATSETTTQSVESSSPGSPACAPVDLPSQPLEVDEQGALALAITGEQLGAVEGSLWLFAAPERACRAEVVLGEAEGGAMPMPGEETPSPQPAPTDASWIAAGAAWEVPVRLDGAGAGEVSIHVTACEGVVAELDLTVATCGEVRLERR